MAPIAKASNWLGCLVVGSEVGRRAMKGPPEQGFGKDRDWVLSRLAWQQAGRSWVAIRRVHKPPSPATSGDPSDATGCRRRVAATRRCRLEPEWAEFAQVLVGEGVCAALSVPVELDGGVIGTLDIYAGQPRDWDPGEVAALRAYAGLVASLLAAAVTAQVKGRLAGQLQAALEHRWLIEQAKGVLMGRERLDAQTAFERLRGAARSSTRRLADVAREVTAGQPLASNRRDLAKGNAAQAKSPKTRT